MCTFSFLYSPPTTLELSQSAFHGVTRPDVVVLVLLVVGLQIPRHRGIGSGQGDGTIIGFIAIVGFFLDGKSYRAPR